MDILQKIAADTKKRVEAQKKILPLDELITIAGKIPLDGKLGFEEAIRSAQDIALICEVKKASPSKGIIAQDFDYLQIAKDYEAAGAAAISVLTEPYHFQGADKYLQEISAAVKTPTLRKDFVVDEYMIYEAHVLGASAVLLICALMDWKTISDYMKTVNWLGISALVEARTQEEIEMALEAGATIIGVNNRDLKTFEVDLFLSEKLRKYVPDNVIFVAESGIQIAEDITRLKSAGVNAALVGESIMRAANKKAAIEALLSK